jgi:uncharacterized protein (DUF2336 family)
MVQEMPVDRPVTLTSREALRLLEQHAQSAQHDLAARTDVGEDVLHYLAQNGATATRQAVAANPAAAPQSNLILADDQEDEVRAELARKIGRLLPGLLNEERRHLRELTLATLERLARDQEARVRAILAEEIKLLDCVPKEIVTRLARDVELAVAAPVIEYSPLLSDIDLLELIVSAEANDVLAAVARRKPLSGKVSEAIVTTLDIPAIAALLTNTQANIRKSTLDRIVSQAAQVSELHHPLVLRTDLSARVIRRIASFVGANLLEALSGRHGLDSTTRTHLNRALRQRLERSTAPQHDPLSVALKDVEAARYAGKLDDGFVEGAAEAGQRETVVLALSVLARMPAATVRRVLAAGSARPLTALVWRAGLSMRVAFKIQTSILRLAARELLPARGGVDFPMTEDEMSWHLSYFGV